MHREIADNGVVWDRLVGDLSRYASVNTMTWTRKVGNLYDQTWHMLEASQEVYMQRHVYQRV